MYICMYIARGRSRATSRSASRFGVPHAPKHERGGYKMQIHIYAYLPIHVFRDVDNARGRSRATLDPHPNLAPREPK